MKSKLPTPTVGAARALLEKARRELKKDPRQAAEKGWLAAVTAARTMLRASGSKWSSAMSVANRVAALEGSRNMSSAISDDLDTLARTLHGSAFYKGDDDYIDHPEAIEVEFRRVDFLISNVEAYCRLARMSHRARARLR